MLFDIGRDTENDWMFQYTDKTMGLVGPALKLT